MNGEPVPMAFPASISACSFCCIRDYCSDTLLVLTERLPTFPPSFPTSKILHKIDAFIFFIHTSRSKSLLNLDCSLPSLLILALSAFIFSIQVYTKDKMAGDNNVRIERQPSVNKFKEVRGHGKALRTKTN